MKVPFISGEGPDGYLPVNLYFSPKEIYGRNALIGRPGLLEFGDTGTSLGIRARCRTKTSMFCLSGVTLYEIDAFGNATSRGTVNEPSGDAWMEWNGSQVGIVVGGRFYIYENNVLTEIKGDSMGFTPASLAFEGGYFIAHDADTENFYESTLYDGTDWNETDYAITSVKSDKLFGVYGVNGQIFAMGSNSGEIYYNSGGSSFAFSKIPGGNIPCGIDAVKSFAEFNGVPICLNNDKVIVIPSGSPVKLSNEFVDRGIANMGKTNDARAFVFTMSGHTFYVITFPSGNKTYVLDFTTKFWYEWRTGTGRWRPDCYVYAYGKHLVGDYTNGKIYQLSPTTYSDDGDEITKQRAMPIPMGDRRTEISSFELEMETGVGISTGQGSDPMVMLDYSIDKGKTWSNELWRSIGKSGEYDHRVKWSSLGSPYHFTPRITITDPVKTVITGAYINGNN